MDSRGEIVSLLMLALAVLCASGLIALMCWREKPKAANRIKPAKRQRLPPA